MSIRPANRLIMLVGAWTLLSLLVAFQFLPIQAWYWSILVVFGVAAIDAFQSLRLPVPKVSRHVTSSLAVGEWAPVTVRLMNTSSAHLRVTVFDHVPATVEFKNMPARVDLEPGSGARIAYRIRPTERGDQVFQRVDLLLKSPLHLWSRRLLIPCEDAIRVFPNFAAVTKFMLLATDNQTSMMGIRKRQRRGEGMEFHQLREYRSGDSLRQVDWKATSRIRKLISREYQDERDQEIVFLLDCGQRMRSRDEVVSHFDAALNAMILLSYVALKQGDAVGLMTFSGSQRWLAPKKSTATVNQLLRKIYDLKPTTHAADYYEAATRLMSRQKKRALVVVMSNARHEDLVDLVPAIKLMQKRHLVLFANLRESVVDDVLHHEQATLADAQTQAAAAVYAQSREQGNHALMVRGVQLLDVLPRDLPVSMVNRYLDIKRSGRL